MEEEQTDAPPPVPQTSPGPITAAAVKGIQVASAGAWGYASAMMDSEIRNRPFDEKQSIKNAMMAYGMSQVQFEGEKGNIWHAIQALKNYEMAMIPFRIAENFQDTFSGAILPAEMSNAVGRVIEGYISPGALGTILMGSMFSFDARTLVLPAAAYLFAPDIFSDQGVQGLQNFMTQIILGDTAKLVFKMAGDFYHKRGVFEKKQELPTLEEGPSGRSMSIVEKGLMTTRSILAQFATPTPTPAAALPDVSLPQIGSGVEEAKMEEDAPPPAAESGGGIIESVKEGLKRVNAYFIDVLDRQEAINKAGRPGVKDMQSLMSAYMTGNHNTLIKNPALSEMIERELTALGERAKATGTVTETSNLYNALKKIAAKAKDMLTQNSPAIDKETNSLYTQMARLEVIRTYKEMEAKSWTRVFGKTEEVGHLEREGGISTLTNLISDIFVPGGEPSKTGVVRKFPNFLGLKSADYATQDALEAEETRYATMEQMLITARDNLSKKTDLLPDMEELALKRDEPYGLSLFRVNAIQDLDKFHDDFPTLYLDPKQDWDFSIPSFADRLGVDPRAFEQDLSDAFEKVGRSPETISHSLESNDESVLSVARYLEMPTISVPNPKTGVPRHFIFYGARETLHQPMDRFVIPTDAAAIAIRRDNERVTASKLDVLKEHIQERRLAKEQPAMFGSMTSTALRTTYEMGRPVINEALSAGTGIIIGKMMHTIGNTFTNHDQIAMTLHHIAAHERIQKSKEPKFWDLASEILMPEPVELPTPPADLSKPVEQVRDLLRDVEMNESKEKSAMLKYEPKQQLKQVMEKLFATSPLAPETIQKLSVIEEVNNLVVDSVAARFINTPSQEMPPTPQLLSEEEMLSEFENEEFDENSVPSWFPPAIKPIAEPSGNGVTIPAGNPPPERPMTAPYHVIDTTTNKTERVWNIHPSVHDEWKTKFIDQLHEGFKDDHPSMPRHHVESMFNVETTGFGNFLRFYDYYYIKKRRRRRPAQQ